MPTTASGADERRQLTVSRIFLQHIVNHEELQIELDPITLIVGRNAAGKTGIIRAAAAVLGGGHDATLLMRGEEEGRAVVLLSNGTEFTKRVRPTKSDLTVSPKQPKGIGPQSFVDQFIDKGGLKPFEVITNPEKRRERILSALNLRASAEALKAIAPDHADLVATDGRDGLGVVADLRKRVFDDRTETNREARRSQAQLQKLLASLPAGASEKDDSESLAEWLAEIDAEIATLQEQISALRVRRQSILDRKERAATDANTRRMIEDERHEIARRDAESKGLTKIIDALDRYRLEMVSDLPLGLSFDDAGEVLVNGQPWAELNTEAEIQMAVKIATLHSGDIPILLVDGLNDLDLEHRRALYDYVAPLCAAGKLQLLASFVADEDLGTIGWRPEDGITAADKLDPLPEDDEPDSAA